MRTILRLSCLLFPALVCSQDLASPEDSTDTTEILGGEASDSGGAADTSGPRLSFLIPAEGDVFHSSDIKVVVHYRGTVPSGMLVVFDGVSLDRPLRLQDDVLTLDLRELNPGVHEIRLLFLDGEGRITTSRTVRFFVRIPEPRREPPSGKLRQFGRVQIRGEWKGGEAVSPVVRQSELTGVVWEDESLLVGKGRKPLSRSLDAATEVTYNAKHGYWEGRLNGLISSEENRFRQPANRLSGNLSYGPWAFLKAGDLYPNYNPLVLSGTRVRGYEAGGALVTGDSAVHWGYAKAVSGEARREISAYEVQYDTGGGYRFDYIPGTFTQDIRAFRLGAGGGKTFDLGVTVMKASETGGDSLFRELNEFLYGARPVENLVAGVDSRLGLWNDRIQVYGQAALSLFTRDRSLGAFSTDSSSGAFRPEDFEDVFVINPTTSGWQYLLSSGAGGKPDARGFIEANSTYEVGIGASLPLRGTVSETDIHYSHLGEDYHSEGNPFLGGNPGKGINLQQKFTVLENTFSFTVQGSEFRQEFQDYQQVERSVKGEARLLPGSYRPSLWISGGLTRQVPEGSAPYEFDQTFDEANIGGFHQASLGPGSVHLTASYGYSFSKLEIRSSDPEEDVPFYPPVWTHTLNTTVAYKFRGSEFQPKASYALSDNGLQRITHNVVLGLRDAYFQRRLKADFNLLIGQYPKSPIHNDLSLGENFGLACTLGEKQTLRVKERGSWYGSRKSLLVNATYELLF